MLNWASFWGQLGRNFLNTTNVDVDQTLRAILDSNRNTKNIKIAVKMPVYAEKMWYVHFAGKCGNMQNMRRLHIRIKLTCLSNSGTSYPCMCTGMAVYNTDEANISNWLSWCCLSCWWLRNWHCAQRSCEYLWVFDDLFFYICQWLSFVIRKSHTGGGSLLSEQSAHVARLTVIDAYFKQINKRILALRQK